MRESREDKRSRKNKGVGELNEKSKWRKRGSEEKRIKEKKEDEKNRREREKKKKDHRAQNKRRETKKNRETNSKGRGRGWREEGGGTEEEVEEEKNLNYWHRRLLKPSRPANTICCFQHRANRGSEVTV